MNVVAALDKADKELETDPAMKLQYPSWMKIEQAIDTLSKVRNRGPGKHNQGLILLDQYFSVPQIGEIIRDMLILSHLAQSIERLNVEAFQKTRASKDGFTTVQSIPEEDQSMLAMLKESDPALVSSLLQLKNG